MDKDIELLRHRGYMTPREFVQKVTPGVIEYMEQNLGTSNDDGLSHPQDLVLNVISYFEVMFHVVSDLGVAPIKIKEEPILGDPEFDDRVV